MVLSAHLLDRIERYKLPREIVFCDEIPRTPTGKVMRRLLTDRHETSAEANG